MVRLMSNTQEISEGEDMNTDDPPSNVISMDEYHIRKFDQWVDACVVEFDSYFPECRASEVSFAFAVANADHFIEQLNLLILSGQFSPAEALEYATDTLANVERHSRSGFGQGLLMQQTPADSR
jgi:hypothetical protein